MRTFLTPLLALVLLLPGCAVEDGGGDSGDGTSAAPTTAPTASVRFVVVHNATEDAWDVAFDPASRPAAPAYAGKAFQHPDAFTVHDLLVVWSEQTGETFQVSYTDDYGHSLDALRGVAAVSNATGGWFWALEVDGGMSQVGLSSAVVPDGGEVRYAYTHWGE